MISITPEIFRAQLKKVPYAIRVFLLGPDLEEAVANLSRHYNLQPATAARVADVLTGILLNLLPPAQVEAELAELGLSKEAADAAIQEMNDRIFAPLQKQAKEDAQAEKAATEAAAAPSPDDAPQEPEAGRPAAPARPVALPPPALITPRPQTPRPVLPPVEPMPVRVATAAPVPEPVVRTPIPASAPVPMPVAPVERPTMRTMAHDVEAMKGGVQPPVVPQTQAAPAPVPTPQPPASVAAPLPKEWAAPVIAPKDVPAFDKTPNTSGSRIPAPDKKEVVSTLQKYGIDPYREVPE